MFGVPINRAANVYCDSRSVVSNASIPKSTLTKKHNSINYHIIHESVALGIMHVAKKNFLSNLEDVLTKLLAYPHKSNLVYYILYNH